MYLDNFRRYPVQQLSHLLIGAFAGLLLTGRWKVAGAVLMAAVGVRQTLEWANIRDTPRIDLAVYIAGILIGIVLGLRGVTAESIIERIQEYLNDIRKRQATDDTPTRPRRWNMLGTYRTR